MIRPDDPRLDSNSPEFDHTFLAHYNEDLTESYIEEETQARAAAAEEIEAGLIQDERLEIAQQFLIDRQKGRIDNYQLEDVLRYYGAE